MIGRNSAEDYLL